MHLNVKTLIRKSLATYNKLPPDKKEKSLNTIKAILERKKPKLGQKTDRYRAGEVLIYLIQKQK